MRITLYDWPLRLPPEPLGLAGMRKAVQRLGGDLLSFSRFDFYDTVLGTVLSEMITAMRPVAPAQLFVACDGPNPDRPGEGVFYTRGD